MRFQTFLFLLLTLSAIGTIVAGKSRISFSSRSRGSSSRGSSSRGSSSRGSSSRGSYGSSSHSTSSSHGSSGSSGSSTHIASSSHGSSGSYGGSFHPASNSQGSSGSYGSTPVHTAPTSFGVPTSGTSVSHPSSGGHTQRQQSTNSNTNFLNAEGGGATRPGSPNSKPGTVTESKQTASPYAPSAPTQTNPSQGLIPSHQATNNPPWSNPHFGTNQPNTPSQMHPLGSNPHPGTNQPNAPSQTYPPWSNPHLGTNQPNAPSQMHPLGSNPHPGTNQPTAPSQTYPPWSNPHLGTNQPNAPSQTYPPWSNPHLGTNQPNAPSQTYPPWSNPHLGTNQPNAPRQTYPPWSNPHLGTNQPNTPSQTYPPWSNPHLGTNQPNAPRQTYPPWSHPPSTVNHPTPQASATSPIGFKEHVYPSSIPPIHQQNSMPMGNPYSLHPSGNIHGASGPTYYPQQPQMFAQPAMQPFVPGQTMLVMQQDSGRGVGQMVKEALVYSTINAGVNRLINPHTHYVESHPASSPTSTTQITYNNHYSNTPSGTDSTAGSSVPQRTISSNNPSIAHGGSTPVSGTTANGGGATVHGGGATSNGGGATVNGADVPAPAGTSTSGRSYHHYHATQSNSTSTNRTNSSADPSIVNNSFYKISDNDIFKITEDLFAMSLDISKYIQLDLQIRSTSNTTNVTDEARKPLFKIDPILLNYPSIYITHTLYDKYEHDFRNKVNRTQEIREHENLLIDTYLNTNVMAAAMNWLGDRGFIDPDDFEKKDVLRRIWFTIFSGSTCGFERVFESENYGTAIMGVQDWLYFANRESAGRINYMSYVDQVKLGTTASLLKLNFEMDGIARPNATIFVGTMPELEMSLYTICFYARSNDVCPISLGGTRFNIYTHSFTYFGNLVMDLGLPIL
ncbi:uncharacterized protein LOC143209570 isoform X2 [Lasioglossum baleicum]|uniref:uncharacterized protein LOC143209570 isoform X2 n=1 Tax=Lasioglossum baleicum TaxID=434251 RepID=UPI003FCD5456